MKQAILNILVLLKLCSIDLMKAACPEKCVCSNNNVDCTNKRLTSVPKDISRTTTHLYLDRNKIKTIKYDDFSNLKELKVLSLSSNGIRKIENCAFMHLKNVKDLVLKNNSVDDINSVIFKGLSSLHRLDMSQTSLSGKPLCIANPLFKELTQLQSLNLKSNRINGIKKSTFTGMGNLKQLDLTDNNIKIIESNAFQHFRVKIDIKWDANLPCCCSIIRAFQSSSKIYDAVCITPNNQYKLLSMETCTLSTPICIKLNETCQIGNSSSCKIIPSTSNIYSSTITKILSSSINIALSTKHLTSALYSSMQTSSKVITTSATTSQTRIFTNTIVSDVTTSQEAIPTTTSIHKLTLLSMYPQLSTTNIDKNYIIPTTSYYISTIKSPSMMDDVKSSQISSFSSTVILTTSHLQNIKTTYQLTTTPTSSSIRYSIKTTSSNKVITPSSSILTCSLICQNKASCVLIGNNATCACTANFIGKLCEKKSDNNDDASEGDKPMAKWLIAVMIIAFLFVTSMLVAIAIYFRRKKKIRDFHPLEGDVINGYKEIEMKTDTQNNATKNPAFEDEGTLY